MKKVINRKNIKICVILTSYLFVGFLSIIGYKLFVESSADSSLMVTALENLYGEWEFVEDFGLHGITKEPPEYVVDIKIGDTMVIEPDHFSYGGHFDYYLFGLSAELTDHAKMRQYDKMVSPSDKGFLNGPWYAKIWIHDFKTDTHPSFFLLSDNEIIIDGDMNHYYRAVKKNTSD